jgi:hypothetical protein
MGEIRSFAMRDDQVNLASSHSKGEGQIDIKSALGSASLRSIYDSGIFRIRDSILYPCGEHTGLN